MVKEIKEMKRLKKDKIATIIILSVIAAILAVCLIMTIVTQVKTNNLTEAEFSNLPAEYWSWALLSNSRGIETLKDYRLISNYLCWFIYVSLLCCSSLIFGKFFDDLIVASPIERSKYNYLETAILEMNKPDVDLNVIKTKIQNEFEAYLIDKKIYSLLIDMIDLKLELKNSTSENENNM